MRLGVRDDDALALARGGRRGRRCLVLNVARELGDGDAVVSIGVDSEGNVLHAASHVCVALRRLFARSDSGVCSEVVDVVVQPRAHEFGVGNLAEVSH